MIRIIQGTDFGEVAQQLPVKLQQHAAFTSGAIFMSTDVLKARSMVAVETKRGDQAALREARRDLAAAKLAQYIRKIVEEAPELTDAQVDAITTLLRPRNRGSARVGDAA